MAGEITVQQKIINLLSDDRPHQRSEIEACLWADDPHYSTVSVHIDAIRKIVRPRGEDVICFRMHGKSWYQHLRKLVTPDGVNTDPTEE